MGRNDKYIMKLQARKAAAQYQKEVLHQKREQEAAIVAAERALWLAMVAIHRAFGIGKLRLYRDYVPAFKQVTDEYKKRLSEVDRDYADGKLEQELNAILEADFEVGGAEKRFNNDKAEL